MDEIIERLTGKYGVDRFLTGGCGAFAVALYMDLKCQGKNPVIVTILRKEPRCETEMEFDDYYDPVVSQCETGSSVDIVSHVLVEVDDREYDARGEVSSEEWIRETKDLLGPLTNFYDDAWSIVRTQPEDPIAQLKHFDQNYCFNEPQSLLYMQLTDSAYSSTTK